MTPGPKVPPFACPKCSILLTNTRTSLECARCHKRWPVEHGIPRFVADQAYWGEFPESALQAVVAEAQTGNWRSALAEALHDRPGEEIDYLVDTSRARWKHYFPLPRNALVLDVGCGMGAISIGLAESGHTVVAAEPVQLRCRFVQARARQDGFEGVVPVCTGAFDIPFPDSVFDGIVLNNVLEWVPLSRPALRPDTVQQDVLKRLSRKLKPGGYLHLMIENRWGPLLFSGLRDPHAGLRYVSFLPRGVANWYSRRKRGEDYRTYLHSMRGYRRMLRRAGFDRLRFFGPVPSSRNYFYYLPLDRPNVMRYFLNAAYDPKHPAASKWVRTISACLPIHRVFAALMPDFSIYARRAG